MNSRDAKVTPTPIATVRSTITVSKNVRIRIVLSDGLIFTSVILAFLLIGEFLRAWLEVGY